MSIFYVRTNIVLLDIDKQLNSIYINNNSKQKHFVIKLDSFGKLDE